MIAAALGWLGTVGTFVAYVLVSRGRMHAESWRYGLLNLVGGVLAGTASVLYAAWPSAASNFVWAALGAVTLGNAVRRPAPGPAREALPPRQVPPRPRYEGLAVRANHRGGHHLPCAASGSRQSRGTEIG